MPTARRGRKAGLPETELGSFIHERLKILNMTYTGLAKRLGVSTSTITRMLNGKTRDVHRVTPESISEALKLDEVDRELFFKLVKELDERKLRSLIKRTEAAFAFSTGAVAPEIVIKREIDLDADEELTKALNLLLEAGRPQFVMESARRRLSTLVKQYPSTKNESIASIQIRLGLLLGRAQALSLQSDQRATNIIQTYNSINNIVCRFELKTFRHEYATLLAHRAPHLRGLAYFDESDADYDLGIDLAQRAEDPLLVTTMLRNRAHNNAILGNEVAWQRQLEEAQRHAQHLNLLYREGALAQLKYAEAGGYKRLAFSTRKELSRRERIAYAQKALQSYEVSRKAIEQNPESNNLLLRGLDEPNLLAHSLTTQLSEIQCLILVAPEEAVHHVERIWNDISSFYPSLLPRLRNALQYARGLLQGSKINPLRLFGRDAWPG